MLQLQYLKMEVLAATLHADKVDAAIVTNILL